MNKFIYIVQAYKQGENPGELNDVVTIEVFAKSEDDSIKKAMNIIKRSHYRVSQVIEKE